MITTALTKAETGDNSNKAAIMETSKGATLTGTVTKTNGAAPACMAATLAAKTGNAVIKASKARAMVMARARIKTATGRTATTVVTAPALTSKTNTVATAAGRIMAG